MAKARRQSLGLPVRKVGSRAKIDTVISRGEEDTVTEDIGFLKRMKIKVLGGDDEQDESLLATLTPRGYLAQFIVGALVGVLTTGVFYGALSLIPEFIFVPLLAILVVAYMAHCLVLSYRQAQNQRLESARQQKLRREHREQWCKANYQAWLEGGPNYSPLPPEPAPEYELHLAPMGWAFASFVVSLALALG